MHKVDGYSLVTGQPKRRPFTLSIIQMTIKG